MPITAPAPTPTVKLGVALRHDGPRQPPLRVAEQHDRGALRGSGDQRAPEGRRQEPVRGPRRRRAQSDPQVGGSSAGIQLLAGEPALDAAHLRARDLRGVEGARLSEPPLPVPRFEAHAAVAHGRAYFIGGISGVEGDSRTAQPSRRVVVFDPATQAWSSRPISPATPRSTISPVRRRGRAERPHHQREDHQPRDRGPSSSGPPRPAAVSATPSQRPSRAARGPARAYAGTCVTPTRRPPSTATSCSTGA